MSDEPESIAKPQMQSGGCRLSLPEDPQREPSEVDRMIAESKQRRRMDDIAYSSRWVDELAGRYEELKKRRSTIINKTPRDYTSDLDSFSKFLYEDDCIYSALVRTHDRCIKLVTLESMSEPALSGKLLRIKLILQELPAALKQQKLLVEDLDDKYHAARIAALHTIEDVEKELRYWRKLETHAAIPEDARPNSENDFDLQFFAR